MTVFYTMLQSINKEIDPAADTHSQLVRDSNQGVYWLDNIDLDNNTTQQVLLFEHNDIFTNKPPKSHINKLLRNKYGA